ncbi:uncharacterized protein METZ01_LOCUS73928 [marine metagenome]|uniref:Uncharacterized protein n=1 Tax=marine metagenome TaxID=408172 RepID=A0A381TZ32_9ZZZZ
MLKSRKPLRLEDHSKVILSKMHRGVIKAKILAVVLTRES